MNSWRDFRQGLEKLIYWLPVIWNDRNWDHTFMFIILRHKLKGMHASWLRNKRHVTWKKDAHRMKVCILLLDRLIDDEYLSIKGVNGARGMHGVLVQRYDTDYLFRMIGKHSLGWWD